MVLSLRLTLVNREFHTINKLLFKKKVRLQWISTTNQLANIFTKALSWQLVSSFLDKIGLQPLSQTLASNGGEVCASCNNHTPPAIVCLNPQATTPREWLVQRILTSHAFFLDYVFFVGGLVNLEAVFLHPIFLFPPSFQSVLLCSFIFLFQLLRFFIQPFLIDFFLFPVSSYIDFSFSFSIHLFLSCLFSFHQLFFVPQLIFIFTTSLIGLDFVLFYLYVDDEGGSVVTCDILFSFLKFS
jgi:hypothetical protein